MKLQEKNREEPRLQPYFNIVQPCYCSCDHTEL